jgi:hypothetical protein
LAHGTLSANSLMSQRASRDNPEALLTARGSFGL